MRARGRGIPGAVVTARVGERTVTGVTDDSGRFVLEDPGPGAVTLEARIFGFQPMRDNLTETQRKSSLAVELTLRQGTAATAETEAGGPSTAGQTDAGGADAVLVQGSVSRDFERMEDRPMGGGFDPAMLAALGIGGPGGMGGNAAPGFGTAEPGAVAGTQAPAIAGGRGGMGGPAGGGMGGPGGGGFGGGPGGGGGFGGPGGGGGPMMGGGRGGMRPGEGGRPGMPDIANMTPEERERFRRQVQDRIARGNGPVQVVGNRQRQNMRNQIRGMANFTERNSALNAAPFSVNGQSLTKPQSDQKNFGFTIGGPIPIGKLANQRGAQFTFNYSGSRNENVRTIFGIVPDAAQRSGDFSSLSNVIYDHTTGAPFPQNKLPASRVSSIATGLMTYIPLANQTGLVQNYSLIGTVPQNSNQFGGRVNLNIKRNRLGFGITAQNSSGNNLQTFGFIDPTRGSGRNVDVSWSKNIRPRLIVTASARYNHNYSETSPFFANKENVSANLGIRGNSQDPLNWGPPTLNFTNYADLSDAVASRRHTRTFSYNASANIVMRRHSLRVGGDFSKLQWNTYNDPNPRGTLLFGGLLTSALNSGGSALAGTGWDFADFLLGYTQQSSLRYGSADSYMRQKAFNAFVQDDWRASSRWTFSLGLRYELPLPFIEKYGRLANLDIAPDLTAVSVVTPGVTAPYSGQIPAGLIRTDRNNFSPRLGAAWRPFKTNRTVVRFGYSIINDASVLSRVPARLVAQPPFATAATFQSSTASPLTLGDPFTGSANINVKNTYAIDPYLKVPRAQTWNFLIETPIRRSMTLDASYIGTKGAGLIISTMPNQAPAGSALTADQRRIISNASGFTYDSTGANSIYHGGQIRLTRRLRRGYTWNVSYLLSKSIDNASTLGGAGSVTVQDPNNLAAERGLSSFDRRHNFTAGSMVTSPFGPQGYLLRDNTKLSLFLREWNLTTNVTVQSGTPLTARVSGAIADPTGSGNIGSGRAQATGLPVDSGSGYFNTLAFTTPPAGQYGNAGRNTIPGPGSFLVNSTFGRGFVFREGARYRLDVNASVNNLLNHVNVTGYGTTVNSATYGLATNAGNMRTVSLSMRFRF